MNDTQLIDWLSQYRYDVTYGGIGEGWSVWHIADECVARDANLRDALNKAVKHHDNKRGSEAGSGADYLIVDLRDKFKHDKHITLWRPDGGGYTHHLKQAGRYTLEQLKSKPNYIPKSERGYVRFAVKASDIPPIILDAAPDCPGDHMISNSPKSQRILENIKVDIK